MEYYVHQALPLMFITEFVFLLSCILLFNKFTFDFKSVIKISLHLLILWPLLIISKAFLKLTSFNFTYVYLIFAAVYALIFGRKNIVNSFIILCVFWTAYVFSTAFAKSAGGVLFNYILQREYTQMATYVSVAVIASLTTIFFTVLIKIFPLDRRKTVSFPTT